VNPGQTVGDRFEVVHEVAAGGMGTVYRAQDRLTGAAVALKMLAEGGASDVQRFLREVSSLAGLLHPHIVKYIAHGTTPGGESYLAMEWLDGETLADRLARAPLTVLEAQLVGSKVAEALAATHRRGIVHRDVKPSNLFLVEGSLERLKILDFGIARRVGERGPTRTGMMVGSVGYMAPEQVRGGLEIDGRADIFSLGCVLFECLTGHPAFAGEDMMAVLVKVLIDDTPDVLEGGLPVPPAFAQLVTRMLAKEPADRPPNAEQVSRELAALTLADGSELASSASAKPAPPPGTLTSREERVLCVIVARGATAEARSVDEPTLRQIAESYGGILERLADGSIVATITRGGAATDLAAHGARLALALSSRLRAPPMVLATGRGVVTARSPMGAVIDHAVRKLRAADGRTVRLDDTTAGLLDARFDVGGDSQGLFLRGERALSAAPRLVCGKVTSCVGRDRELAVLEGFFTECVEESVARAVLVTAPPGTGKSRLRHEILDRLRARGGAFELLVGRGDSLGAGSPFGMIAPAIRWSAGIADGEALEVRRHKLRVRLARCLDGKALDRACEFLGELVDAPVLDAASEALRAARENPILMADAMCAAWQDWLEAESGAGPIVLVLEDLHWGDLPSIQFIDAALRSLSDRRLLVLALARPEVHEQFPGLWHARGLQEIRLGALTRRACERLVRQILGESVEPDLLAQVVDRCEGNPFFLEELVRAAAMGSANQLPDSVLGMVEARLDALGDELKQVLRAASLFGETFWQEGVAALAGTTLRQRCGEMLEELAERELVLPRPVSRFPGLHEFAFRHGLVREAAYSMLTENDRSLGHNLAGAWLEQIGEREPLVLAEHFRRGKEDARAAEWYRRAAAQALEANDLQAAITQADLGIVCGASGERLAALRLVQAQAHAWRGEHAHAERWGVEAAAHVDAGTVVWFGALGELIASLGEQGRYRELESEVGRAMKAAAAEHAATAQLHCLSRAGDYLIHGGRFELARAVVEWVEKRAFDLHEVIPTVLGRLNLTRAAQAVYAGDFSSAATHFESGIAAFAQAGDARNGGIGLLNIGFVYSELGQLERAEAAIREALKSGERMGLVYLTAHALQHLSHVLTYRRQLQPAWTAQVRALELLRNNRRMEGIGRIYLATIALLRGDAKEAERYAVLASENLRDVPPQLPGAQATLARALLAQGRTQEALAAARAAQSALESISQVEEFESLVRLVLAESLAAAGERESAASALALAARRVHERSAMIPDPAWRRSFLQLPDNARTLQLSETKVS
jgi:serine/threonine protein kinase/tetratricopeptide (TPR) repeat protein